MLSFKHKIFPSKTYTCVNSEVYSTDRKYGLQIKRNQIPELHLMKYLLLGNKVQPANTLAVVASLASHLTWDLYLPVKNRKEKIINAWQFGGGSIYTCMHERENFEIKKWILTTGLFWILRARLAYFRVLRVSSALISAGLMQAGRGRNLQRLEKHLLKKWTARWSQGKTHRAWWNITKHLRLIEKYGDLPIITVLLLPPSESCQNISLVHA